MFLASLKNSFELLFQILNLLSITYLDLFLFVVSAVDGCESCTYNLKHNKPENTKSKRRSAMTYFQHIVFYAIFSPHIPSSSRHSVL